MRFSDPQRRARAALGIAAVLIFVGGQLGEMAHNAVVRHRVCAEHGTLEHVGSAGHVTDPAPSLAALELAVRPGSDSSTSEHEHCHLGAVTRTPLYFAAAAAAAAPLPAADAAPAMPFRIAVLSGQAIHRLAPKQSPPA